MSNIGQFRDHLEKSLNSTFGTSVINRAVEFEMETAEELRVTVFTSSKLTETVERARGKDKTGVKSKMGKTIEQKIEQLVDSDYSVKWKNDDSNSSAVRKSSKVGPEQTVYHIVVDEEYRD